MNKIKYFIIALALSSVSVLAVGPSALAATDANKQAACEAIGGGANCATPGDATDINNVVPVIINILSVIIGIVAVIMIIIAGLKYITSGGDSNKTASAKNTLIYALIGLVIVALAQFITNFVLDTVG